MTAPSKVSGAPRTAVRARDVLRARRFPVNDGVPVDASAPAAASATIEPRGARRTTRPV